MTKFKSQWKKLTNEYPDISVRYVDVEGIRIWQLTAGEHRDSDENENHLKRAVDRHTLLSLIKYAAVDGSESRLSNVSFSTEKSNRIIRDASHTDSPIQLTKAALEALTEAHPLTDNSDVVFDSIKRLHRIYQSENTVKSTMPRDVLRVCLSYFIVPDVKEQLPECTENTPQEMGQESPPSKSTQLKLFEFARVVG